MLRTEHVRVGPECEWNDGLVLLNTTVGLHVLDAVRQDAPTRGHQQNTGAPRLAEVVTFHQCRVGNVNK